MAAGGELGLLELLQGFGTSGPVAVKKEKKRREGLQLKMLLKLGDVQPQTAGGAAVHPAWP